jgi:glycosyltransferase involved in cell wall biosynthesis
MKIVLYRRRLNLTSGAGQLIRMQAEGLRAAGERVVVASRRGRLGFSLASGIHARRATDGGLRGFAASPYHLLVDHGMEVANADLVFVHNLMTEALRHLNRPEWAEKSAEEAHFFRSLDPGTPVVANSRLVADALVEHFALDPDRVIVHYPGIDADRFRPTGLKGVAELVDAPSQHLRSKSRNALRLPNDVPLIGFVTSGEFDKRGLDIFIDAAERIAAARRDARFLVVGARRLPDWAKRHRLVTSGRMLYRPKSTRPERWFAALDVFLFPARFEEFGMVVSEARASGLPVLTSRRVGAAECLPDAYEPWLLDVPDGEAFAEKALALLADDGARAALAAAGAAGVGTIDRESYVGETIDTIRRSMDSKAARSGREAG